jgi:uncharacterized protein YyaL (SSP411 family)
MRIIKMALFGLLTSILAGIPMKNVSGQPNHLVNEPSLYLQQHAHNPIDWYPWGEEALTRARTEDKPIFLSIGYSSCHWCHVMEQEVFEHDDVAHFMNAHFICIKVDREERPDLDAVYMEAVQMMTGRGGWPMSVFLTPELKPFYGGTYFPKAQFLNLTAQIEEIFRERRGELEAQAEQAAAGIRKSSLMGLGEGPGVESSMITAAVDAARQSWDKVYGGFRQSQKFPTPVKWRFLLHEYRHQGDEQLGRMIVQSCEAMAQGGLYDHVGGGFHRYTVDERWTVPHFEKMLYDNGQLAGLMLEAGVVFDRPDFTASGLDVLDFLLRDMRADDGGIFASYDADSGGEEGSYYVWDRAEIAAVAGPEDGPVLADLLGVSQEGNFEHSGKSVLTRRSDLQRVAREHGRSAEQVGALFDRHRAALRAKRDLRTPPGLDRKVVTSWNGLAITALVQGYAVSGETRYLEGARKAADFLLDQHRRPDGSLWRTTSEGRHAGEGVLDDYAFLADGLLELYQVSGQTRYLAAARQLTDFAIAHFQRPEGGFYLSRAEVEAPLGRRADFFDSVEPAGNSVMMVNLIRLGAVTGETSYHQLARNELDRMSDLLDRAGLEMAWWFDAARRVLGPYHDVVVVGSDSLARELIQRLPASAVVSVLPVGGADAELLKLAPALEGKTAIDGQPTAYVCHFGTCQAPTGDAQEMLRQALAGWEK